jgi:hypothetical protein
MLFDFVTEDLLNEEDAKRITAPLWVELTSVWSEAFRLFNATPEETRGRIERSPIAKAGCLNAIAASIVQDNFVGREAEQLEVCEKLRFVKLYVTRDVVLRFNSLTSGCIVRNIKASPQKDAYFRQEPLSGIWPGATRLTVGYITDAAKAELARVEISLQVGEDLVYHFPIDGTDSGTLPITAPKVPPKVPAAQSHSEKLRKSIH